MTNAITLERNAFGQLIDPMWRLPIVGHFPPFEWMTELFAWGGFIGIIVLIAIRQRQHPRYAQGDQRQVEDHDKPVAAVNPIHQRFTELTQRHQLKEIL